jgi:hypothetical protein
MAAAGEHERDGTHADAADTDEVNSWRCPVDGHGGSPQKMERRARAIFSDCREQRV